MDKKELKAKKQMLLKQLEKEKQNKKNSENKLSLYEYKEKELKVKKEKASSIPEGQKHTIVPVAEFEGSYNYDKRRKDWHAKAGHNETQLVCAKCKDDDNWETILLDDGRHICYYCWIKKPTTTKKAQPKKVVTKTTTKPAPKITKVVSSQNVVPVEEYERGYINDEDRAKKWHLNSEISEKEITCNYCSSTDNFETILLSNKKYVCYDCWMAKKPVSVKEVVKNNSNESSEEVFESTQESNSKAGKLFTVLSLISGLLLIALIVVLSLGIITEWNFWVK